MGSEREQTGWLVEENSAGFIHWVALSTEPWPRTKPRIRRGDFTIDEYLTPIERVKDANDALRFARKQDADAFIKLFDRFLLCPVATEHMFIGDHLTTERTNNGGQHE